MVELHVPYKELHVTPFTTISTWDEKNM